MYFYFDGGIDWDAPSSCAVVEHDFTRDEIEAMRRAAGTDAGSRPGDPAICGEKGVEGKWVHGEETG